MSTDGFRKLTFTLAFISLLALSGCGTGGSSTNLPPGVPTIILTANANSITAGQSVSLSWTATASTSITITAASGSSTRTLVTSSQDSGNVSDSPTVTTTYTAVATGSGGTSMPKTAMVQVTQMVAPQVTQFTANPTTITAGQATILSWTTTNATSITVTATSGSSTRTVTTSTLATGSVTDSPTSTTTYSAVATGAGGTSAPQTATVTVTQIAPQITQFTANPMTVIAGQATTLSWTTTNATSITITATSGSTTRTVTTSTLATGSVTDSPTSATTYSAVATGVGGTSAPQTATVTVTQVAPQITQFTANPTTVTAGQATTLSWTTTNATTITITATSGSSTRTVTTSTLATGSVTDSPTSTTTYSAVATGAGGTSAPQTATVTVTQIAPQITQFTANPTTVTAGQATTLSWTTTNAISITITATSGSSTRTVTTSTLATGSVADSPIAATTYTAVATGAGGTSAPQTAVVQIAPQVTQFTANPTTVNSGQSTTLTWTTTNATSITITATAGSSSRTLITSTLATGTVTDAPTVATTYTAVATGPGGASAPVAVTVQVAPQITSFTATPSTISAGQTTTIAWATTNATSVIITPSVQQSEGGGGLNTTGSSIVPVNSTTVFTITATGPGGTATASLTVTVPLTLSLIASPTTITSGSSSTLTWSVSGGTATSLSINNGVCNPCTLPTSSASVSPTTSTTYTATAIASNGSSITQSATVTVNSGTTNPIKHIFFMLQENRAYDMYSGQLAPYRAQRLLNRYNIVDNQTIDAFNPTVTLTNAHTGVTVQPFHESNTVCTENLTPAWDEAHHDVSLIGGDPAWETTTSFTNSSFLMQGFLDTTDSVTQAYDPNGTRAMGYYNQDDLPYYYDLATFFASSDEWHSPVLANTVPNRMYLMAGTSFGHEYPDGDSNHPLYAAPTIFRAMNTANVSWLYYYKDGIFLANFADFYDPAIEPKTFPITDLLSRLSGVCNGVACDPDLALPQVIFIDSASGSSELDEHPGNNIQSGAAYVQSIIAALMQSDAWKDSVFILSYDEGGGLYDHVPPINVPLPDTWGPGHCLDPNNGSTNYCIVGTLGGTFDLTGFRVPLTVISPFAKSQYVSHIPRDYTAILAFIETTFNVANLSARDLYWQDSSRNMSEFFDFTNSPSLNPPAPDNALNWTQVLNPQTTTGVCNPMLESGP